jgi:very-short-patch-repair endonuclease
MDPQTVQSVWELARRQHGVVSRAQLLERGFGPDAIKHRVARGRLHPVARGVYVVGRRELSRHGRWMGAVLSCGPEAVLSHGSAAALWEIAPERRLEVAIPLSRRCRRPGIVIHRRSELRATTHRGIPVTPPIDTLVDLAATLGPDATEAAINEADKRDLCDPERLREALDQMAPRPGVGALKRILDLRTFTMTDSELERRFLPLARRAGLPDLLTQQIVNGFRVDFFSPELKLVIETDGLRYHRTPAQQARDLIRDQTHSASGLRPLRFSRAQVRYDPAYVEETLAALARKPA